jgi:bile acid-coenzyme A ligase
VPFPDALQVHVRRDPDRTAVVCDDDALTRGQLDARSNQVARALASRGVTAGRLVALVLPNSVDLVAAVVACWKLGAVPLPLSARLPVAELDAVLAVAEPATVVHEPIDPAPFAAGAVPVVPLAHWKAMATGGSTGTPKVVLDRSAAVADPLGPQNFMRVDGAMLVAGPLYHSGPFINTVRGLLAGNTIVLLPRFDAEHALALIERHRVDWTFLVPTMQHRIWRLGAEVRDRYDVSSLRAVVSSGGPYPAWLKAEMIGWLGPETIQEAYGGTEQIGGCAISGTEALRKPGSVGRVRAGFELRIRDETGGDLPPHEVGQVWFRALDGVPRYEYLGASGATGDAGAPAAWGTFGDLGWVDDDGYLFLADRRTDLIVTGGANVYPAEVEAAIESFPAVRSSAVIGLPDDDLGRRVHAIVDVGDTRRDANDAASPFDVDALRAHVAARVAPYKVPRSFEVVHEALRDESGKVRRFALRAARVPEGT